MTPTYGLYSPPTPFRYKRYVGVGGHWDLQGPTSCPDRRCTNAKFPNRDERCEKTCGIRLSLRHLSSSSVSSRLFSEPFYCLVPCHGISKMLTRPPSVSRRQCRLAQVLGELYINKVPRNTLPHTIPQLTTTTSICNGCQLQLSMTLLHHDFNQYEPRNLERPPIHTSVLQ